MKINKTAAPAPASSITLPACRHLAQRCGTIASQAGATLIFSQSSRQHPPFDLVEAYFGLLEELRSILATPVELVMADAITNPYIITSIDNSKRDLHVAR